MHLSFVDLSWNVPKTTDTGEQSLSILNASFLRLYAVFSTQHQPMKYEMDFPLLKWKSQLYSIRRNWLNWLNRILWHLWYRQSTQAAKHIQGEPKLSDYFVFNITTQWIVIHRSIKDDKIANFINMLTVHTIFTKALLWPRPFPHGTRFWTCSIQCDVLPRLSLAHMFLWISTEFQNGDHFDRKEHSSGFSTLARSL